VTGFEQELHDREKILKDTLGCKNVRDVNKPDFYELLGVEYDCSDVTRIQNSYADKYRILNTIPKNAPLGKRQFHYIQMLIGTLAQAKLTLCDDQKRADYNLNMKETVWSNALIGEIIAVADANNRRITDTNIQSFITKGEDCYHLTRTEVTSIIQDLIGQGRILSGPGPSPPPPSHRTDWVALVKNLLMKNWKTVSASLAVLAVAGGVIFLPKGAIKIRSGGIYQAQLRNQAAALYIQVLRNKAGEITALDLASRERLSFKKDYLDSYTKMSDQGPVVNGAFPGDQLYVETTGGVKVRGTVVQNDGILILQDASGIEQRFVRAVINDSRKY
jgi:hypothetical protein